MVSNMRSLKKQGGVALIMAVVAVAIIALIAVAMSSEQTLLVKRLQNSLITDTSWQCALAGEQYAATLLKKKYEADRLRNQEYDNLNEYYPLQNVQLNSEERAAGQATTQGSDGASSAQAPALSIPIPLENTPCSIYSDAKLEDLQGKINLANLFIQPTSGTGGAQNQSTSSGPLQLNSILDAALDRLFANLGVPNSNELRAALQDWVDDDVQELPNGAEDSYYQTLEKPYLTANRALASLEELKLVKGFNEKVDPTNPNSDTVYNTIKDYLVVLPGQTDLNVNTADEQVLRAFMPHLNSDQAKQLVDKGNSKDPYKDVDSFKQDSAHQPTNNQPIEWDNIATLAVKSEYFAVNLTVVLGGIETPLYSVLRRTQNDGFVNVVRRLRGRKESGG